MAPRAARRPSVLSKRRLRQGSLLDFPQPFGIFADWRDSLWLRINGLPLTATSLISLSRLISHWKQPSIPAKRLVYPLSMCLRRKASFYTCWPGCRERAAFWNWEHWVDIAPYGSLALCRPRAV